MGIVPVFNLIEFLIKLLIGAFVFMIGGISLIVGVCEIFDGLFSKSKKTLVVGACLLIVALLCGLAVLLC